ncbi:MAG TPA: efflux transporter outer membrane subunit [Stellaceae bacterium]|nr:efflux transporter outer membrane subunit [Stellaceae bacterium]
MRAGAVITLAVAGLLAGCLVGPDYERPAAPTPVRFKEAEGWKLGEPQDAADRGQWWAIYNDPVLDALERTIDVSNQNLRAAEAAYRQARAVVAEARAGLFPTLSVTGSGTQSGQGGGGSRGSSFITTGTGTAIGTGGGGRGSSSQSTLDLTADLSWSIDLWGRIRRTVESDVATAQASAADLANARLSAQAQLATLYFELRASDELKRLLDAAVVAFTQSLQITRNQYAVGVVGQADVVTAETLLEQTRAQGIATGVQRAQFEHAIASLVGKPPGDFAIEPALIAAAVPVAPPGVPSGLLERRPDIAGAERRMAGANAQIGVAVSAFYPDLTLSASYGFTSSNLSKLLRAANNFWSVGPQLAETVFDAGLRSAQVAGARATYDETVAVYRQTVLTGFQQVEDELAALRILAQQADVQANAVRLAREAERLTLNQYQAGTVAYTAVLTAQTTALANEETEVGIKQSRLVASVALIQALGGGWNAAVLPNIEQVESDDPPAANP